MKPADTTGMADPTAESFWRAFCREVRLPESTPHQVWSFGDTPKLAHQLLELVLHGPKRATAGLAEFADALPQGAALVGGYSVLTEFDGTPRAVIRTTALERRPFNTVDAAFAWDEGEGDRTLADWKAAHRAYFSRELAALGRDFDETMLVDLERFELLCPFEAAMHPVDCGPRIVPACLPGGLLQSAELQIAYYARRHGFGPAFERERRRDIAGFLAEHDGVRDAVWLLVNAGKVLGSIVIDGRAAEPELRWFIVDEALRGQGWGRRLMACAMEHCAHRYESVALHTFSALTEARQLYEAFGFRQIGTDAPYSGWGPTIIDQAFRWRR